MSKQSSIFKFGLHSFGILQEMKLELILFFVGMSACHAARTYQAEILDPVPYPPLKTEFAAVPPPPYPALKSDYVPDYKPKLRPLPDYAKKTYKPTYQPTYAYDAEHNVRNGNPSLPSLNFRFQEAPKYAFDYLVRDDYSYVDFGHKESRDGDYTQGEYHVLLPDGRLQTVTYSADGYGYVADVKYSGEPTYEKPAKTYDDKPFYKAPYSPYKSVRTY